VKITYSWGEEGVDAADVYFVYPIPVGGIDCDIGPIDTPNDDGSVILSFDRDDHLLEVEVLGASALLPPSLLEQAGVVQSTDISQSFIDGLDEESKKDFLKPFDSPEYRHAIKKNGDGEVPLKTTLNSAANTFSVHLDYPLYEREIVTEVGPISTPEGKGAVTLGFGGDNRFLRIIVHGADSIVPEEMRDNAEKLGHGLAQ
jgi:hypothetical protein